MSDNDAEMCVEKVAELRAQLAEIEADAESRRAKLLKPIKSQLAGVDKLVETRSRPLREKLRRAEARAAEAVLAVGASVKTETLMAVYTPPRVSWDRDKLEGLALALPQILGARTVAESGTVAFRAVKQ